MLVVTVILLYKIQNHPTNQFVGNLDKLYIAGLLFEPRGQLPFLWRERAFSIFSPRPKHSSHSLERFLDFRCAK